MEKKFRAYVAVKYRCSANTSFMFQRCSGNWARNHRWRRKKEDGMLDLLPPRWEEPAARVSDQTDSILLEKATFLGNNDANAHHTIWVSININNRDRNLLEFLVATNLEILNRSNEPTFCIAVKREVLDLIICYRWMTKVKRRVLNEPSLFDKSPWSWPGLKRRWQSRDPKRISYLVFVQHLLD